MADVLMTKKDLLAALAEVGDDDLILIRCNGGDYWGHYVEVPEVRIMQVLNGTVNGNTLGHPGARCKPGYELPQTGKVALIGE